MNITNYDGIAGRVFTAHCQIGEEMHLKVEHRHVIYPAICGPLMDSFIAIGVAVKRTRRMPGSR